jgi:CDP-diacylglycerol--serine O-phosphatidyltransferase
MVTLLGLVIGVSSIRFALDSKWEMAVYCVFIAAIIDGIDGRIARMLNATSPFGAELDSLCDFVNFGLSPALLIYLWSFQQYEFKVLSWAAIMVFVVCMAIRLARFNTSIGKLSEDKISKYFFTGVPAPSGALLALVPMMLDFELTSGIQFNARSHTLLIDLYIVFIAFLLASRLPTLSFKNFHIKPEYLSLSMMISALFIIVIVIYPWYTMPAVAILYLLSIPVCFYYTRYRLI